MKQFTTRDNFGQADFFLISINPNNDGQNDTEFLVFSTGTQGDAIVTSDGNEDWGWNAVWDSAVKHVDDGWIVEMKIPYAALRFANQEDPTTIIDTFFKKYQARRSTKSQINLLFRFIQYIERQVVLFDAVEDAAFPIVNNMEGIGTLLMKECNMSRLNA